MTQTTQITVLGVFIWITLGCAFLSSIGLLNPLQYREGDSELEMRIIRSRPALFAALMALIQAVFIAVWPLLLLWGIATFDYPYWFHRLTCHPLRECSEEEFAAENRQ